MTLVRRARANVFDGGPQLKSGQVFVGQSQVNLWVERDVVIDLLIPCAGGLILEPLQVKDEHRGRPHNPQHLSVWCLEHNVASVSCQWHL